MQSDPLFDGVTSWDWVVFAIIGAKVFIAFGLLMTCVMVLIWAERKIVADMQNRIGPNRAGPGGILITLADGIKLFFKEQSIPTQADKAVFRLAPYLALVPALVAFCVIPVGGMVELPSWLGGRTTYLQVAEIPSGVLLILVTSGIAVYSALLAGWASGSKYPLLGSVRASAQMLSYETALALSILGVLVHAGTLSTRAIVDAQAWDGPSSILNWYAVPALVPFAIFLIAIVAETNRAPFDLVEAEQELVGGFHTEYTGIRFAVFFLAEYVNMITMSALAVTLFLGGPAGPTPGFGPAWPWPIFWFVAKVCALLFGFIWLRAALPRLRYDQLMRLGWAWLIPIALLWLGVATVFVAARHNDWPAWSFIVAPILALAVFGLVRVADTRGIAAVTEGKLP